MTLGRITSIETPSMSMRYHAATIRVSAATGSERPATGDPRRLCVVVFRVELAARTTDDS
jgi:hypothetical protein